MICLDESSRKSVFPYTDFLIFFDVLAIYCYKLKNRKNMKYLKLFDTHSEYEEFAGGGGMLKPNVSHCVQENEVHYNPIPHDYSKDYLTIESLEDGNVIGWITRILSVAGSAVTKTISASTDNGMTWTEYTSSTGGTIIAILNNGNKLLVKGLNDSYASNTHPNLCVNNFKLNGSYNVSGNIMSMVYGDSFYGDNTLTTQYVFQGLFRGSKLISAENLVLPARRLTDGCYYSMFNGCTSLTTAPELPATTLASSCYGFMFDGCTSLTSEAQVPNSIVPIGGNYCSYMYCGCPITERSGNYNVSAYDCYSPK